MRAQLLFQIEDHQSEDFFERIWVRLDIAEFLLELVIVRCVGLQHASLQFSGIAFEFIGLNFLHLPLYNSFLSNIQELLQKN